MENLFKLVAFFTLPIILHAQNTVYFNKTFKPDTINTLSPSILSIQDGYLIAHTYNAISGNEGFAIRKLNHLGETQWFKNLSYGVATHTMIGGGVLINTLDNNYLLTSAITQNATDLDYDITLFKFNENGDLIWSNKIINPNKVDYAYSILPTSDKGYIMAGIQHSQTYNNRFFILKTDSMGNEQWSHQYHPLQHGAAFSIFETDTGYIASGAIQYPDTDHDMFVMEIDEQGNVVWEKNYGGVESDNGGLITPINNNFFLAGAIKQNNITNPYIARLDSIGNTMWTKTYHVSIGGMQEAPPQLTSDGGFVCLYSYDTEFGYRAPWFWRFTATGDTLWTRRIPGMPTDHNSYLKDIAPTHDGGWLLSGFDYSEQSSWAVKLDSLGHTCSYLGCDSTASVGLSFVPPPPQTAQLNIMPNPAKEFVTLSWATTLNAKAELLIYDYTGKIVLRRFVSGNAANINLDYLPNGLYICQITDNGMMVASGKVTIFK